MDKELRSDADEAGNPHSTFQRMKFIKSTEFSEEGEGDSTTTKGPEAKMKERLLVSSDMQREELRQKWEKVSFRALRSRVGDWGRPKSERDAYETQYIKTVLQRKLSQRSHVR